MLGYLLDAFLLSAMPLATESERRRNSDSRSTSSPAIPEMGGVDPSGC